MTREHNAVIQLSAPPGPRLLISVPVNSPPCHSLFFSPQAKILGKVLCSHAEGAKGEGKMTGGKGSSFLPEAMSWRWAVREPARSEVSEMNERNTQTTKQSAAEDASSALAKSLLSFHPFSPNNSCPLIPCYSTVRNKTSLWLSVFLVFPRVGLITGD